MSKWQHPIFILQNTSQKISKKMSIKLYAKNLRGSLKVKMICLQQIFFSLYEVLLILFFGHHILTRKFYDYHIFLGNFFAFSCYTILI